MVWVGQIYFQLCAAIAVLGAFGTIASKNPVRGAMALLAMILAIAGLFLALDAQFLAAVQLIVYAGAVVVLFLFIIMMLGPAAIAPRDQRGLAWRCFGGGLFGLLAVATMALMAGKLHQPAIKAVDAGFGGVGAVGRALFSDGLVPFEVSSALLMVAILGAVAVAKGRQGTVAQVLPSGQPGLAPRASIQPHGGAKAGESRGGDDE